MKSPLFKAQWAVPNGRNPITQDGPVRKSAGLAAADIPATARTAVVLRDSQGADHPDNAGKFFLQRIIR